MVANEAGSGGRESTGGRFESLNGIVRKGLNEQLTLEQKREEPPCVHHVGLRGEHSRGEGRARDLGSWALCECKDPQSPRATGAA